MSARQKKTAASWAKALLRRQWMNFAALVLMVLLTLVGMRQLRTLLLTDAYDSGTAMARFCAAEAYSHLEGYSTLMNYGTLLVDEMFPDQSDIMETLLKMDLFWNRMNRMLENKRVTPYLSMGERVYFDGEWNGISASEARQRPWYGLAQAAGPGETVFTDVYTDMFSGEQVISMAQKCKSEGAIMVFDVFYRELYTHFAPVELEPGESLFLCDSQGNVLYQQTEADDSLQAQQEYCTELIQKIQAGKLSRYDDYVLDMDGKRRAVYFDQMESGWFVLVTVPYANILGMSDSLVQAFALVVAVFLAGLLGVSLREARMEARNQRTNETVRVLGNVYYALYRVNTGAGTYEMIKGSDYARSRIPPTGPYSQLLPVLRNLMEPEIYQEFEESFSLKNMRDLMQRRVHEFGGDFQRLFGQEYRWMNVHMLFDESLAPEEVVLCFREVTREKAEQLQERKLLEEALEVARKNEAAKQSFFSSMSHDMRTPLNAISGLSELAAQNLGDTEKIGRYLSQIRASSQQLLNLINDILDMSRMEQGKLELNSRAFDLAQCLSECLEPFHATAEMEKKAFQVDVHLQNTRLMGDPFRLTQVMNNLLSNAFKFTREKDSISVQVTQISRGDFPKYRFVVSDTGIGMSQEFLPRLFEPYTREARFGAPQISGTGLGMSITRNLVSLMNGEIHVVSQQGAGATFTVILPFQVAEGETDVAATADEEERPPLSLKGKRILLAEDNDVNMEITTELLRMNGVEVTQAWNGREALERFREAPTFAFDAVLMDMQMPDMDGCEATRRIRALARPDAKLVPILAVTANAFAEDVATTEAAGMNAHISKPIDFGLLCRTLERCMHAQDTRRG